MRNVASDAAGHRGGQYDQDQRAAVSAILDYALVLLDGLIASFNEEYEVQPAVGSP
jgi:hypothetical protein